jgi:adenosylcobinamide-GDP ribazoletransferase
LITLIVAAVLFPFFSLMGLILIGGTWIVSKVLAYYFKYKFAGLTGDNYGAINEVAEVMALIFVIVLFDMGWG